MCALIAMMVRGATNALASGPESCSTGKRVYVSTYVCVYMCAYMAAYMGLSTYVRLQSGTDEPVVWAEVCALVSIGE